MNVEFLPLLAPIASSTPGAAPVVFVVDDDPSVRQSLEPLIRRSGYQPQTFATAREFLSRQRVAAPSCLVVEVALPDLNGLDLLERIAESRIGMPTIFISHDGDVPTAVRAMKAGAVEFLTKPLADEVLLDAIRGAIERSRVELADEFELRQLRQDYASLSQREREVMALVAAGLLNKQVGAELGISEITVKAHRGKVMQKMQADSLADLVKIAARLRIAPIRRSRRYARPQVAFHQARPSYAATAVAA